MSNWTLMKTGEDEELHAITGGNHLAARFEHILDGKLGVAVVLRMRSRMSEF